MVSLEDLLGKPRCTAIIMNSDLYENSIRLDDLVGEKLRYFVQPGKCCLKELEYEISSLKSLLYMVNQDRIVTYM